MDSAYYLEYFNYERNHWWFLSREIILSNYISKLKVSAGLKILNVGCGTGRTSEMLQQFGEVTSLEYDKDCCEFTQSKTELKIINGSVLELPFKDSEFDLVCAFDVIEHVEDDKLALSEMKRVLKKTGNMIITVPAFMSLWSHHDEVNHHFRRYTSDELISKSKDVNLKLNYSSYFNFILFFPIYLIRLLSKTLPSKTSDGTGSDFEKLNNSLINSLLTKIMSVERFAFNFKLKLPFGVSYFVDLKH